MRSPLLDATRELCHFGSKASDVAMTDFIFDTPALPSLTVNGFDARYAVHRIFCVGRNYVAHAAEMGGEVDREAPWYFTKSPANLIEAGGDCPYPLGTQDYHHEVELAVALGPDAHPFAFGVALDMTRRDRQAEAKAQRRPWDVGKDVEGGAVFAPMAAMDQIGAPRIMLSVNGDLRQDAHLSDMVWSVPEILHHLSTLYSLGAGDVILTGTPAGVGPVVRGDVIHAAIDGLPELRMTLK